MSRSADRDTGDGLDTVASADERRRSSGAVLYRLLLDGLDPVERARVIDVCSYDHDDVGVANGTSAPRAIW